MADQLLNLAARVLLKGLPPLTAHLVMLRLGALFPQRTTAKQVQQAASALGMRGTCLSRTLALTARAPWADVVIGVQPGGTTGVQAHAWLEAGGVLLDPIGPAGTEIARLPGRPPPPQGRKAVAP